MVYIEISKTPVLMRNVADTSLKKTALTASLILKLFTT